MGMLIAKNIAMGSDSFDGAVSDAFKRKAADHFAWWNQTFDVALQKIDNANDLDFATYAELFTKTAFNLADGVSDAITLGGAGTAKNIPTALNKFVSKVDKRTKIWKSAVKLKNVIESNEFKLLGLLVDNGWQFTDSARGIISSDTALQEQLKNIGIFSANFVVGKVIENKDMSKIKGFVSGKLSQAIISFLADVVTNDSAGQGQLLQAAVKAILDAFPIVGPIRKEYQMTQEILSRQKPEELAAWQEYMSLQASFRTDTDAMNKDITLAKLQMTLKAAEQRFSNMNDVKF
jgi:hypothetical protein